MARLPAVLFLLVALGVLARIAISLAWEPTAVNITDLLRWSLMARDSIFLEPGHPGGYAMFLRALHAIPEDLTVTIALQHLLGIATALALFATVRRAGAPSWQR